MLPILSGCANGPDGVGVAVEKMEEREVIRILPEDEIEVRASGEIQVSKAWTDFDVLVAFRDFGTYQDALGAEIDPSGQHELVIVAAEGAPAVVLDTVEGAVLRSRGTICGTASARMMNVPLTNGAQVLMDFAPQAEPLIDGDYGLDLFRDCDTFAREGSCGDRACVNVSLRFGRRAHDFGMCEEFFTDSCWCKPLPESEFLR